MNDLARPIDLIHHPRSASIVICIHGFTSTPFAMRELAHVLFDDGHDAQTILLPGHGTTPGALGDVRWTDWVDAVKRAVETVRQTYTYVFLCGQSMGAALSLLVSTDIPVDGVVTISAGYRIPVWKIVMLRMIAPFVTFIGKHDGPDIKDPEARQTEIHYDRMAVRGILELARLIKVMRRRLHDVRAPLLLIHAAEDHTFPHVHQMRIAQAVASSVKKTIVLTNSYHVATLDYDKSIIHDGVRQFLRDLIKP